MLQVATFLFVVLTFWWVFIKPFDREVLVYQKYIWSSIYVLFSILGGIYGLIISKRFDGYKSLLGRVILAFSIGLFLQAFGQITYTYYLWFQNNQAPYPSLGDVGYFGTIFAYIYGVFILARYIGVTISVRSFFNKILAIIIPLGMLVLSYLIFLKGYEFDWSNPLRVFLDFGYPLGDAIYLSFALLILLLSKNVLGGVLRKPILFLVFALIIQYISDFYFLYQASKDTWYVGGIGDYLYTVAYFAMTFVIIYIGDIFERIKLESSKINTVHSEIKDDSLEQLFNQILTEIIKRQVRITGSLAWQEVRKVPSILISDETTVKISITNNPKKTIDQLLQRYKNLFGDLAVQISKNAVYDLTIKLPPEEVPESLR